MSVPGKLDASTQINIGTGTNAVGCWDEGRTEDFGRRVQGGKAQRILLCPWTNRLLLAEQLLGGATHSGTTTTLFAPQHYPDVSWMTCQHVHIDPAPGRSGLTNASNDAINYDYARLTVDYSIGEFSGVIELGEESLDYSSDAQPLSQAVPCFQWADTGEVIDTAIASPIVRFNIIHFTRVIKMLPVYPEAQVMALQDCVNDNLFLGAPAGQLLFRGAKTHREFNLLGNQLWTVSYAFSFRSKPWNQYYAPKGVGGGAPGWYDVEYTDGTPLYASGDFTTLGFTT